MKEFIIKNFAELNDSVVFIAAVIGFICLKKYKNTKSRYFIYFLIFAAIVDFFGGYPKLLSTRSELEPIYLKIKDTIFINNYWWFTLFWAVGSALFFSYYYRKILISTKFKIILKTLSYLLLIITIVEIILDWKAFMTSFIVSIESICFIVVILSAIFYLIEILNSEKILEFYKSINFYISVIILFWWLITTPLMFYDVYFTEVDRSFYDLKLNIILFSNIFMYLSFSIALLWCKPQNN